MSQELIPYSDIEKMGKAVSQSGLFGVKTDMQAIALMLVAQAQGMHPATAAMTYHIIQGRPSKKSEAMLADFLQCGGKVQWHKLDDTIADATFSHPQGGEIRLSWDMKTAEKAGLTSKDGSMYKKYPRQMLRSRLIAEGVRTIYPAATGGFRAAEEMDEETTTDPNKSRLDNIIDAHVEPQTEKIDAPKEDKKDTPKSAAEEKPKVEKEMAKTTKKDKDVQKSSKLPDGQKEVIGIIEEIPKIATVANPHKNGVAEPKHSFKIGDKYYGTFDAPITKGIMACVDKRIMVKIRFTERRNSDGTRIFNDIVGFEQATADEVLPV